MKKTVKRLLALTLCLALLPVDGMVSSAKESAAEPPRYMRELSRLVAETAGENDFGEIRLTVGEPEMTVDSETQPIADDANVVPYVDAHSGLQIPAEVIEQAQPNGSGFLSEEELQEQGFAVAYNADTGDIRITEPYGLCRLIVTTADGTVRDTYGAVRTLALSAGRTVLQYADKESTAAAAEKLCADPLILACAADRIVSVDAAADEASPVNPDSRCWGTERVGADVWMAGHADDELAQVVVAVIDTGVDASHPFLRDRVLSGGWDFVDDDDDPSDGHYHGTHCAGIVRDATPINVKILPVRVLGTDGKGDNAVCMEAIRWAVDQGADILSMSFGSTPTAEEQNDTNMIEDWLASERDTIRYAYDAGVTCVAAAGNDANDLDVIPTSPAVQPHVITVGSIDAQDTPSYFSNHGSMVDVCAPGESIISSVPDGRYQALSGTSMATPLVAAVCANYLSTDKTRTPDDVLDYVTAHAEDVGAPGRDEYCGAGCVSMRDHIPVSGMTLPFSALRLPIGTSMKLQPVFTPADASNRTVTFMTSDPDVVTVDSYGSVYMKNAGFSIITAVSTDGGFRAQCMIEVFGGSGVCDVFATRYNWFVRRTDGTIQYSGLAQPKLGSQASYLTSWSFVRDTKRMPLSGVTQFWELPIYTYTGPSVTDLYQSEESYFMKEDGKLRRIENDGAFVLQKRTNGRPLTGVTQMQASQYAVFALNDTGTVYTRCGDVWEPVRTADGSVLQNVRRLGVHAAFCADGSVWFLTRADGGNSQTPCTLAVPYTPVPEAVDGFILAQTADGALCPMTAVFALADGTVLGVGDNKYNFLGMPDLQSADTPVQIVTEDGQPVDDVCALHYNGFGVFALRQDGTVLAWGAPSGQCRSACNLGVGMPVTERLYPMPVVLQDGTALTGVRELLPAYSGHMLFRCMDDSVWICGFARYEMSGLTGREVELEYAVPFTIADEQVYILDLPMEPFDPVVPAQSVTLDAEQIFLGVGDSIRLSASVLPANADNPQLTFVCVNGATASVTNSGVVTGVREGTTTVRACAAEAPDDVYAECSVTVGSAKMASVSVSALPYKTVYSRGEALDTDGGELCIRLQNGAVETVPLYARYCSGFDPQRAGWQRVTVGYAGLTASFSVFVRLKEVVSVTLTEPDKTDYLLGEELDLTGGALTIRYDDDTMAVVPLTPEMCLPFTFNNETDNVQQITVKWLGFSLPFLVRVHAPQICGIGMYALPDKLDYENETQIDPAGGEVVYLYEDGSQGDVVPLTREMCDAAFTRPGTQTVTVTLDGFTTSFPVNVRAVEGATLSMLAMPDVRYYAFTGATTIDPHGGKVLLRCADGTRESIPITQDMCSLPEDRLITADNWNVTVTYLGLTTSFQVYNYRKALDFTVERIEMQRLPDRTELRRYVTFDPTGGVVRLYGADGQTMDLALSQSMLSGSSTFYLGERTITVKLENCITTFPIRVLNNMEYTLLSPPDKTVFCLGETFSTDGLEYRVTQYTNDPDEPVVTYIGSAIGATMCTGFDTKQVGAQTVSVKSMYGIPLRFPIYVTDMTLDCDAPRLQCGQSTWMRPAFRYTPQEMPALTWSSSDESVAAVNRDGRVTAVGVGTAEITASVNEYCTAVCTVTVQAEEIEPDALVFVQAPTELLPGSTVQYLASALPLNAAARALVWTSSDPSVLTVDETGTVTAVRTGTATLTAQIEGAEVRAVCAVTVTDHPTDRTAGDTDGDGMVTLKDATLLVRWLAGGWDVQINEANADVNADGRADLKDVVLLRRYLADGWNVVLR